MQTENKKNARYITYRTLFITYRTVLQTNDLRTMP